MTEDGHELIYDVRKTGDLVGELCASEYPRQDRAVALERADIVAVPELREAEFALTDIDARNLDMVRSILERMVSVNRLPTGIVAMTVLLAVSITETVWEMAFAI